MFILKSKDQLSSAKDRKGSDGVYGKCGLNLEKTKAL